MAEQDDDTNWKGTGMGREQVRQEWEALPQEKRPGWAKFVQEKRELHERNEKKVIFEKALAGYSGVKLTIPADSCEDWLKLSAEFKPLKVRESEKVNHKQLIYRVTDPEKEKLKALWESWKVKQTPAA